VFPSHQIAHVGVTESIGLKLFAVKLSSTYSNLCAHAVTVPTDTPTDRQTDRRTDDM